jgi:hypothetical protein
MNMTTLNPSNAKYISDFFTNYVFEAASKDKLLSQLFSLPEFSQPLAQGINQFFQNSSSQNIEIDLDKLSSMNQNFDNLAPEPYENEEIPYGSEDNGSSGFLGESNQATMVISFNLMQCIFVIPMCIGFAISALVGAAIG